MGQFEMRINSLSFNIDKSFDEIGTFSIGHEGCAVKFLKVVCNACFLAFLEKQRNMGKQIRIVTPIVPERHLNEVETALKEMFKNDIFRDSIVVVNDYGLLNFINKTSQDRKMCLGRSLIFSFEYTPWGHNIFESESKKIQQIVSQVSFYDDEKIRFFRERNIVEIEANLSVGTIECLKEIQNKGFKVNIHKNTFLYGTQRSCYFKRKKQSFDCCGMECEQAEEIQLVELWEDTGYYYENIDFPNRLFLYGNQILGEGYNLACDQFDGIILDSNNITM